MKQLKLRATIVAVLMMAAKAGNVYATGTDIDVSAGAKAFSGAASFSQGGNANANGSVEFNDRLQIPNSPGLSSGSSNTTAPHRIYKQRQVSFVLGGYTNIDMVLDLPSFIGSNPSEDVQLGACIQDEGFRKWRELKGNPCPK